MRSTVLIVPAPLRPAANLLAMQLGWGPENYTIPLSATGEGSPTHFGLHTWANDGFFAMVEGAMAGQAPAELTEAGFPLKDLQAILGALVMSVRDASDGHFAEVIAANGLKVIEE